MNTESTNQLFRAAYKLAEVAALVGKKRGWAYRMVREGRLPVIRGYGILLIPAAAVEDMLATAQPAAAVVAQAQARRNKAPA